MHWSHKIFFGIRHILKSDAKTISILELRNRIYVTLHTGCKLISAYATFSCMPISTAFGRIPCSFLQYCSHYWCLLCLEHVSGVSNVWMLMGNHAKKKNPVQVLSSRVAVGSGNIIQRGLMRFAHLRRELGCTAPQTHAFLWCENERSHSPQFCRITIPVLLL